MNSLTDFQKKVYKMVKKIPRGKVLSYQEMAKKIGKPSGARAVGSALSKNLDSQVPCHRVVRSDGSVGGYRRGSKEKIKKLKTEGIKIKNGKIINF